MESISSSHRQSIQTFACSLWKLCWVLIQRTDQQQAKYLSKLRLREIAQLRFNNSKSKHRNSNLNLPLLFLIKISSRVWLQKDLLLSKFSHKPKLIPHPCLSVIPKCPAGDQQPTVTKFDFHGLFINTLWLSRCFLPSQQSSHQAAIPLEIAKVNWWSDEPNDYVKRGRNPRKGHPRVDLDDWPTEHWRRYWKQLTCLWGFDQVYQPAISCHWLNSICFEISSGFTKVISLYTVSFLTQL